MRAPNLHLPHLHMPHLPPRGERRMTFRRPTAAEAWMLALLILFAVFIVLGLAVAISNPGIYAGANGEYPPLAPS